MDNSETYIKMCEKAVEIQNSKPNNWEGSYYLEKGRKWAGIHLACIHDIEDYGIQKDEIWLPRQDELQEIIVKSNTAPLIMLIALFDKFTFQEGYGLNKDNKR